MFDSLDAWANGDTVTSSPAPVTITAPARTPKRTASRRNASAGRNAAIAAALATRQPIGAAINAATVASSGGFTATARGDLALDELKTAHAPEAAWICDNAARGNPFAFSLLKSVRRFGSLTPRQLDAVTAAIAKEAARVAPVTITAPAPISAPVTPVNDRAGSMGSVQLAPVAAPYVAPVAVVPVATVESFKLAPAAIHENWPPLFTDAGGNSVADCGGGVVCIASDGLPVKFARFGAPGSAPVTVAIDCEVWADFAELSRAEFTAKRLA